MPSGACSAASFSPKDPTRSQWSKLRFPGGFSSLKCTATLPQSLGMSAASTCAYATLWAPCMSSVTMAGTRTAPFSSIREAFTCSGTELFRKYHGGCGGARPSLVAAPAALELLALPARIFSVCPCTSTTEANDSSSDEGRSCVSCAGSSSSFAFGPFGFSWPRPPTPTFSANSAGVAGCFLARAAATASAPYTNKLRPMASDAESLKAKPLKSVYSSYDCVTSLQTSASTARRFFPLRSHLVTSTKKPGSTEPGHQPLRFSHQVPICVVLTPTGFSLQSSLNSEMLCASSPLKRSWYSAWQNSPHCSVVEDQPCPVTVSCSTTASSPRTKSSRWKLRWNSRPCRRCSSTHTPP
mmetsp:Transcript_83875/g.219084  ORF Transcript_83875/g.219084 Transcript_83875/m.219084 type:complete len:354 (-) Transcript_83875:442-1503(-)